MLVCFALEQEAGPFKRLISASPAVTTIVTGMGLQNANRAVQEVLRERHFDQVLSCGFAAGLNPQLRPGTVLFQTEEQTLVERLRAAGAIPARFALAPRLLITAAEKAQFRKATGADAAQFESEAVHAVCRRCNIPFAVVRVILDAAGEDLPLDFNEFLSAAGGFQYGKFFLAAVRAPGKVRLLIALAKRCRVASKKLAGALAVAICQ